MTARDFLGIGFVLIGIASLLAARRSAAQYYALADDYRRRWPFRILPSWFVIGQWVLAGALFVSFGMMLLMTQ